MTRPRLTRLLLPALLLLGTAQAAVKPEWIKADFNGDGRQDVIATTNLFDIVFNPEGEAIFWYVKQNPGSSVLKTRNDGTRDFSGLQKQINLVGSGKAFDVALPDNTSKPTAEGVQVSQDNAKATMTARFQYTQGAATVTKTIVLHPRQFKVDTSVNVTGADRYTVNFSGLGRNSDPVVRGANRGGQLTQGAATIENAQYAALLDKPSQTAHAIIVRPQEGTAAIAMQGGAQSRLQLRLQGPARFEVYGGKNELIHLYQEGYTTLPDLFRPNIFGQISLLIVKFMEWLYSVLHNWGLVILVLTVVLRAAIWPLMQTQGKTTARMQLLQPKLKEVQEKYKDDPQKMQAETMRMYREYNVNPAGCLSSFIPFPILIALWSTIRNFEFDSGLGWLPDLSIPDPLYILAALYVAVNLLQLYVSTRKSPEMFRQQSFIYLIFAYFALTFPAGVTLYWIISTVIGTIQQVFINRHVAATMDAGLQRVERAPRKTVDVQKK
ncbi:membrane protein insertase YidC [Deinococcus maricopensis]|uniref:Membrane protein insertase YidC n=1 Tax=Deinococcus maricopensis (strain DSM 21211 / LMG 22137 / NRRL B-23946 / LB-34) TaxID=709986 RepID=E8U6M4_DEIML|nr:membrane protein insertase YidC [Deinococcus maricopensis]ADV66713.1 membrane protein insertase, YidC/Oxa1 family [Deinococcus maricopensis DSM 21211]